MRALLLTLALAFAGIAHAQTIVCIDLGGGVVKCRVTTTH